MIGFRMDSNPQHRYPYLRYFPLYAFSKRVLTDSRVGGGMVMRNHLSPEVDIVENFLGLFPRLYELLHMGDSGAKTAAGNILELRHLPLLLTLQGAWKKEKNIV